MNLEASGADALTLICPYCGHQLEIEQRLRTLPAEGDFGVLRCACYRYAVLDGIPILRQQSPMGSNVDPIVDRLLRDGIAAALATATGEFAPAQRPPARILSHAATSIRKLFSLANSAMGGRQPDKQPWSEGAFRETLYALKPRMYADYLYYRHANNSFMAAATLVCLLRTSLQSLIPTSDGEAGARHRVLDLSCGIGHTSYLISTLFPSMQVVGVDWDFSNLRLAKRYLCKTGTFVCLDAELPLPFPDQSFAACLGLDGLHYIRSKVALLRELDRVLLPQALWLFPHLHNALQPNPAPGVPVAPDEWERLLAFIPHRILSEGEVLESFVRRDAVDLRDQRPLSELSSAAALAAVATRQDGFWRLHEGLSSILSSSGGDLMWNPIYAVTTDGANVHLTSRWPSDAMRQECQAAAKILPESFDCPDFKIASRQGPAMPDLTQKQRELAQRFMLVGLPPAYREPPPSVPSP
jgi:SAM-dependent methyltransferase